MYYYNTYEKNLNYRGAGFVGRRFVKYFLEKKIK